MSYPRLAMRLYNTPLLLSEDKAHAIEQVFRYHEQGTAKLLAPYDAPKPRPEVAAAGQAQRTQSGYIRTADGIAVVSALGTLVQRTGSMDAESGLTSYMQIGAQIAAASADPQVKGILLEIDSSGGEVNGIFDLADEMRVAAMHKPMVAHANEVALSGGYVLAAAANQLYAPRTGLIGSIGVRMMHVDQSAYDAKRGVKYTDIVAGDRKAEGSPHAPLSDEALQWAQDHVNHTYDIFVDYVAQSRGIDEKVVRGTEAAVYHAEQALELGLIDGIGTINAAMAALQSMIADRPKNRSMRAAAEADRTSQTASDDAERIEIMAGNTVTQEDVARAKAEGIAEGRTAAQSEAATAAQVAADNASKAAQTRIAGILTHAEADGRRALAEHFAFESGMSIEDAGKALAKAPKEAKPVVAAANPLAAAMAKEPNPQVGADAAVAGSEGGDDEVERLANFVMTAGKPTKLKVVGEAK